MDLLSLLQAVGSPKLRWARQQYLREARQGARDRQAPAAPHRRMGTDGSSISPGVTTTGAALRIALSAFEGHGVICGATGSGKSCAALSLMQQLIDLRRHGSPVAFGVIDAKGELFQHARGLFDGQDAGETTVLDFGCGAAPYALLHPRWGETPEVLIERRLDTLGDLLGRDGLLSLRMARMLRNLLSLAVEHALALPVLDALLSDPTLIEPLAQRSTDARLRAYFAAEFPRERQTTAPALGHRLAFLLRHEPLRLAFGAPDAPDLQFCMDRGMPILVNCGGPHLPRGLSRTIQSLVMSDLRQAIFARKRPTARYLWFVDEAQCLLSQPADADNLAAILAMARSFGTHVVLMTQSLTAASPTRDFLASLDTNLRWLWVFRCGLDDARLLEPGLTVSGRVIKRSARKGWYTYLTPEQERAARLRDVTSLPPRVGYFWLRGGAEKAVILRSHDVMVKRPSTSVRSPLGHQAISDARQHLERQEQQVRQLRSSTSPSRRQTATVVDILTRLEKEFTEGTDDDDP
jgi:hypothetical protein